MAGKTAVKRSYVATEAFEMSFTAPNGMRTSKQYSPGDPFPVPENWVLDADYMENMKHPRPAFREDFAVTYKDEYGKVKQELSFRRVILPLKEVPADA